MKEDTRVNLHLDIVNKCKSIKQNEESVLFYFYRDKTVDLAYAGDLAVMVDTIMQLMNGDNDLKDAFITAVDLYNEDNIDLRLN